MKNHILVLYDNEKEYANLMGDYLKKRMDLPWDIHVYTENGQLLNCEKSGEVSLLVVAESSYAEELEKLQPLQTILLNESGIVKKKELRNVNKYQRAENVLREIMEVYSDIMDEPAGGVLTGMKTKFIGIYSPIKRCMQTTFALTLSQMLSEKHKTLYLNFEHYAGLPELMPDFGMKDLADLLYFLNTDKDKFLLRMRSMVQKKGELDYIPPMRSGQNLLSVTGAEWQKLIKSIDEMCGYEYVVMDLTDSMQGLFDIMRGCARIYTLTHEDRVAQCKLVQYEQILALYRYDDILAKTKKCNPPKIRRIPDEIVQYTKSEMADYIKMQIDELRN